MKSTVETLSPTRVRLEIEVPFGELTPSIDKAYKSISHQISVPGFRKGKVPPRLIDRQIGRGAVLDEAINSSLPNFLTKAYEEHTLRPIGNPDVEPKELADGEHFSFTAEVDVRPELSLPDMSELDVVVDEISVSEEDVDKEVENLRERFSTLKGVERPAGEGDFVSIDLLASVDGEAVPDGSATGVSYRVGSGDLVEGLDEAVTGMSAGEEKTFTTTLVGGEAGGREADVAVTVVSVKERELPAADDEFAQLASEFDSLGELREDLKIQLERRRVLDQSMQARDRTLQAILGAIEVPLPVKVVESEVEFRGQQFAQQLAQMGMEPERYYTMADTSEEEQNAKFQEEAEHAVRSQLVLDAFADAEKLGVTQDELTGEVIRRAAQMRTNAQAYADYLNKNGQLPIVAADLRRGKALSLALERAKVVDTAGSEVDIEAVRKQLAAGVAKPTQQSDTVTGEGE